jgi:hypothetical protein
MAGLTGSVLLFAVTNGHARQNEEVRIAQLNARLAARDGWWNAPPSRMMTPEEYGEQLMGADRRRQALGR